jgi:hypothetical protein
MINYLKKNFLTSEIIVTTLISFSLWFSLGTKLQIDIETFSEKKILLENFRHIFPIIILILITTIRNENKNLRNLKFVILIIFISYLIGYLNFYFINESYSLNLSKDEVLVKSGYVPNKIKDFIFCFYFVVTFLILLKLNNEEIKKINVINYVFIFIVSFITLYYAFKEYFENDHYYLYYTNFLVEGKLLGVNSPRSLGLARNLVIITIPLTIFCFFIKQETKIKYFIYFILIVIISLIIQTQSRSSNYFLYSFILFLFLIKIIQKKYKDLIIIFFISLILPALLSNGIPKIKTYLINQPLFQNDKNRLLSINPNNLTAVQNIKNTNINIYSSGRVELWKKSIDIFLNEEDFKLKIFGFGPLSDRYFIKENLSNALIYIFFAGGFLGLVGVLLLYAITIREVIKFISFKTSISSDLLGYSSIFILIFLMFRSLVETSFAIFGTDHIIFITNLIFIKNKNKKIFR